MTHDCIPNANHLVDFMLDHLRNPKNRKPGLELKHVVRAYVKEHPERIVGVLVEFLQGLAGDQIRGEDLTDAN